MITLPESDFRPISCCNTIYKYIAKILANRLAASLPRLINPSQGAFVKGRRITDNILLAQELLHGYHLRPYFPRVAFKVDMQKAYDTLDWGFLLSTLQGFGFPQTMIDWIMEVTCSPKFSININEELHGYFASGRGLRQGDPLVPYLFILAMEIFSAILRDHTSKPGFRFHWRCKKDFLTHLFFADHVLLFCEGNLESIQLVKSSVDLFASLSGLTPSPLKSEFFVAGDDQQVSARVKDTWNI